MKKATIMVAFLVTGLLSAQEIKPKYEIVGNEIRATYFYDNGQIKQVGNYLDGKLNGTWVSYNEQGEKQTIGEYTKGKKTGQWVFFSDEKLSQVNYTENKIEDVKVWKQEIVAKN
mgnify:CR=1 FL=1